MDGYLSTEELDKIRERNDESSWVRPINEDEGLRALIDRDDLLLHIDSLTSSIAAQALYEAADYVYKAWPNITGTEIGDYLREASSETE